MEEIVDINVDIDGSIKPQENDKVALIDADTMAFTACLNVEYVEDLLPREMYSDTEWDDIVNSEGYDEEKGIVYHVDIDQAVEKAEEKLERIFDKTGCRTCELHFTSGRENFRYKVKEDYKANRSTLKAPINLRAVKEKLFAKYGGSISKEYEADDIYVYKLKQDFNLRNAEREELSLLTKERLLGSDNGAKNTHNQSVGNRLYDIWQNMINRCVNSHNNYEDTMVYTPWVEDFVTFRDWANTNGYLDNLTIDRIDSRGHYIPSNVQFISKEDNTAKSILERTKVYTFEDLKKLSILKKTYPSNPNEYKGSFKEYLTITYGEENAKRVSAAIHRNKEFFHLTELEFITSKLSEGTKFKHNSYYYIIKNNKAEFYRDFIGVCLDKDCYNSVPTNDICKQFNYYESGQWGIEMKWVEVSEGTAKMWPYLQTITGDKTDNIQGCHGIGPKKALKFIGEDMTEAEMWDGVVRAWESKGLSSIDAIITMNLVNMHMLQDREDGEPAIINWLPNYNDDGSLSTEYTWR
jgi:hypothetical protein